MLPHEHWTVYSHCLYNVLFILKDAQLGLSASLNNIDQDDLKFMAIGLLGPHEC